MVEKRRNKADFSSVERDHKGKLRGSITIIDLGGQYGPSAKREEFSDDTITNIGEGLAVQTSQLPTYQWDKYLMSGINILLFVYDANVISKSSGIEKRINGWDHSEDQGALKIKDIFSDLLQTYIDIHDKEMSVLEDYEGAENKIAAYDNQLFAAKREYEKMKDDNILMRINIIDKARKSALEEVEKYKSRFSGRTSQEIKNNFNAEASKLYFIIPVANKIDLVEKNNPNYTLEDVVPIQLKDVINPDFIEGGFFVDGLGGKLGFSENMVVTDAVWSSMIPGHPCYYNVYDYMTQVVEYFVKHLNIRTIKLALLGPGAVGKTTIQKMLRGELKQGFDEKLTIGADIKVMSLEEWVNLYPS